MKAMRGRIALRKHFVRNLLRTYHHPAHGRGCGVGRSLGIGFGLGVGVGRTVAVGVAVGVALGVGVTVGVGVGVGVGPPCGAWISTVIGGPVLKKSTVASLLCGGWSASNRKLYNVPKRIALAFWLVAKVSVLQVIELASWVTSHGVLLYPASPWVPSCGKPGC